MRVSLPASSSFNLNGVATIFEAMHFCVCRSASYFVPTRSAVSAGKKGVSSVM